MTIDWSYIVEMSTLMSIAFWIGSLYSRRKRMYCDYVLVAGAPPYYCVWLQVGKVQMKIGRHEHEWQAQFQRDSWRAILKGADTPPIENYMPKKETA